MPGGTTLIFNRWTQPDSIVPNIYDPQAWDRFAYVDNNPVRYNDPSGHCLEDACILELVVITAAVGMYAYVASPQFRDAANAFGANLANFMDKAFAVGEKKPLTEDEQDKVDHLEKDSEGFLRKHPDLEEEAQKKARGETLEKGDHPGEAEQWVQGLENDIAHLQDARRSRDKESQAAIDRAIERGQRWIDEINRKLYGKE